MTFWSVRPLCSIMKGTIGNLIVVEFDCCSYSANICQRRNMNCTFLVVYALIDCCKCSFIDYHVIDTRKYCCRPRGDDFWVRIQPDIFVGTNFALELEMVSLGITHVLIITEQCAAPKVQKTWKKRNGQLSPIIFVDKGFQN